MQEETFESGSQKWAIAPTADGRNALLFINTEAKQACSMTMTDNEVRRLIRALQYAIATRGLKIPEGTEGPMVTEEARQDEAPTTDTAWKAPLPAQPLARPPVAPAAPTKPSKGKLRLATLDGEEVVERRPWMLGKQADDGDDDKPPPKATRYVAPPRYERVEAVAA